MSPFQPSGRPRAHLGPRARVPVRGEVFARRRLLLASALALWLALVLVRLQVDDPAAAVLVLQVLPVGIVAACYGLMAGAVLAALSMAAVVVWATANGVELGAVGYLVRGAVFGAAALAPALSRGEPRVRDAVEASSHVVVRLPRSLEALTLARDALGRFDGALSPLRLYEAKLLTTELVANAIRHGSVGPVELRATLGRDSLRVDVGEQGRELLPELPEPAARDFGGLGLQVVDSVSTRWGARHGGSRAWFEIDRLD